MLEKVTIGKWLVSPIDCSLFDGKNTSYIEPKSMDLLMLLAANAGELVSREHIMKVVWKDRVVTEYALNNLISSLRKQLNEAGTKEAYIITRPKLGYQLIATVKQAEEPVPDSQLSPPISTQVIEPSSTVKVPKERVNLNKIYLWVAMLSLTLLCAVLVFTFIDDKNDEVIVDPSIAVLPFEVFDSEQDIAYFADGLAEEIIHQLAILPELRVVSRTSSFSFRDKVADIQHIAERLGVSYILEGSVRKVQGTMRVTVQLINAFDDTHVWSKVFTASLDNRFVIQHQISTEVAHAFDSSFTEIPLELQTYSPDSSEAFLRLLRGRKLNKEGTAGAYIRARDEFQMATMLDPNYADAFVDLAVSYILLAQRKRLDEKEAVELASEAIESALNIDPELASAHAAKGMMYHLDNQAKNASESFQQALSIDPYQYLALINYANLQRQYSMHEAALEHYNRAKEVAPLSADAQWGIGNVLIKLGRLDEATKQYEKCVYLLPEHINCLYGYAYALRLTNQNQKANSALEKINGLADKDDFNYRSIAGFHKLYQGKYAEADKIYRGMLDQFGFNIGALQSITFNQSALNATDDWYDELSTVVQNSERPKLAVYANYAINAYLTQQCDVVIPAIEKIVKHRFNLVKDTEILINGVNYLGMLAHCYQQTEQLEKKQDTLATLEDIVAQLPKNESFVGGYQLIDAQIAMLKGETDRARSIVDTLVDMQWPLAWFVHKDPMLSSIAP